MADPKPRRPTLSRDAAILGARSDFQSFIAANHSSRWDAHDSLGPRDRAAAVIKDLCDVQSRREFDTDPEAGRRFTLLVALPFSAWRRSNG
ncbi:hypothetical protein CURE108131_25275 [Cupriavidus respiraculi]|uniref:Uncharacterized protein n=1 Tax=Cupriavidus respiraculi TaxID=195930 RepID=A0ABM8XVH9_9BURK|nr:hypothetical protein LMG21510_05086 [Cupriavidus respiraculi]